MTNKYLYENTYQEHIQLRGEQCCIINLEQASRELNYLHNLVTYLEDCNNEIFCVILKWIHHHKNKENYNDYCNFDYTESAISKSFPFPKVGPYPDLS